MKGSRKYRFESELHLGLLVIVVALVALNLVSNYVVFRARVRMYDTGLAELNTASVGVGRVLQQSASVSLSPEEITDLKDAHGLSDLIVAPSLNSREPEELRHWFRSTVRGLPPDKIIELSDQLLKAETNNLVRGRGTEYLFVRQVAVGAGSRMVILSKPYPELAYLEDSGSLLLMIGEIGLAVVALIYLLVSRFVLAPFKRMKQKALDAGRSVEEGVGDVEQVVVDYERIITDLQRTEAELRALNISIQQRADSLEEFNRYLMAAVDSGVITMDMTGRVLTVSGTAERILDLSHSNLREDNYDTLLNGHSTIVDLIRATISNGTPPGYREYSRKSRLGESIVIGVTVSFIRGQSDQPIGLLILLNDLTELASLRNQVEQNNRLTALGEMAGGLAHQLRNSLGAIVGYGALTKKRIAKQETESTVEAVESLLKEAHEAEELVARFLTFARPLDYRPAALSLNELLESIIDSFRHRSDCKHVRIKFDQSLSTADVVADAVLLKQAIANLIENAVHACQGAAGEIEVRVESNNERVQIHVTDYGSGIDPEIIEKIFTPFYSTRPSGTGLGLPLARRIIDLHGGVITVESKVGFGTTFTVSIPLAKHQVPAQATPVSC